MKKLILLFTLVFAFGFSHTLEAQPVPGDVVNETQVEKPEQSQRTTCKRPQKRRARKASMNQGNGKKTCNKGQQQGKATKTAHQSLNRNYKEKTNRVVASERKSRKYKMAERNKN